MSLSHKKNLTQVKLSSARYTPLANISLWMWMQLSLPHISTQHFLPINMQDHDAQITTRLHGGYPEESSLLYFIHHQLIFSLSSHQQHVRSKLRNPSHTTIHNDVLSNEAAIVPQAPTYLTGSITTWRVRKWNKTFIRTTSTANSRNVVYMLRYGFNELRRPVDMIWFCSSRSVNECNVHCYNSRTYIQLERCKLYFSQRVASSCAV